MQEMTVNEQQRLFVEKNDNSYSCLGFDVVYGYCMELSRRIKKFGFLKDGQTLTPVLQSQIGTVEQYKQYQNFLSIVGNRKTGTWFNYDTPTAVRMVLEKYRKEGGKIRIFYGNTKTGLSWMDEFDMIGSVGRSNGTLQVPLIIEPGNHSGSGILDNCIVRIIDADTREELYRHKNFHLPEMEIRKITEDKVNVGYSHAVMVKNMNDTFETFASFKSYGKAAQWVAFMSGECNEQPN